VSLSYSEYAEYLLFVQMSICAFSLSHRNYSSHVYNHQRIGTIGSIQTSPKGTFQLVVCDVSFPSKERLSPCRLLKVTPLFLFPPPFKWSGSTPARSGNTCDSSSEPHEQLMLTALSRAHTMRVSRRTWTSTMHKKTFCNSVGALQLSLVSTMFSSFERIR